MTQTPPLIYLLAAAEDLALLKDLEEQLKPIQARGLLRVFAD